MDWITLSELIRQCGDVVPAPRAPQKYGLGAVLVRNPRTKCLIPIGDVESWAAEGCKPAAASLLGDIHSASAGWTTQDFISAVRIEASGSRTAGLCTKQYSGEAVKMEFAYYGYEVVKAHPKNWFAALAQRVGRSPKLKVLELFHIALDRGWDLMKWQLDRKRAIPDECKGILDGRIYIVTDHLLAATVPETQSATASIASHDSEKRTCMLDLVAYRVIGAIYDTNTGELKYLETLEQAHQHTS